MQCAGTTYYLDCAFPQWRVSVEGFGDKFHRSPRNRKRELRRLADLASVHWRVLPVTWDDITDTPDDVVAGSSRRSPPEEAGPTRSSGCAKMRGC